MTQEQEAINLGVIGLSENEQFINRRLQEAYEIFGSFSNEIIRAGAFAGHCFTQRDSKAFASEIMR